MLPKIVYNLGMETNIRKKLVETCLMLYTSIVIPQSLLNSHIEVYYEEDELTREIHVYNYSQPREKLIEVYEPCPKKCPNETLSEGYGEPDPQRDWDEEEFKPTETFMTVDPILLQILQNQWSD